MTYEETLDFLYEQLPMFSRIGAKALKIDLSNTLALCELVGNPQHNFKSIHIAGTNGKGSVSHSLAAILQSQGYKTGLYTSPHLKDFRERIRINGEFCDKDFIIDFVEKIKQQLSIISPSFFEMTVAMAFSYFASQNCDIVVVETGLGGRLDSTNIITPEVSVITNIGWDHMDLLGDTLPKIAFEKAGIIKKETPAVIGEVLPETKPVFVKKAIAEKAPIFFAQEEFTVEKASFEDQYLHLMVKDNETQQRETYILDLPGIYQEQNLVTILATIKQLRHKGWQISTDNIKNALSKVKSMTGLRGRWDILQKKPYLILDVGHNKSCMEQIVRQLNVTNYDELYIICGFVKDKDITSALQILPKDAHYSFTQAHIPRALDYKSLQTKAASLGLKGDGFENVNDAIKAKLAIAKPNDLILVCGSIFLVAEVDYE